MGVCRFFLNGNCRYGDRCWNEHPRQGGGYVQHSSKGDYLVSLNQKSLFHSSASGFSFNKALSDIPIQTRNKFGALQFENRPFKNEGSRSPFSRREDTYMQEEPFYAHQSRWSDHQSQQTPFYGNASPSKGRFSSPITTDFNLQHMFGQTPATNFSFRQAMSTIQPEPKLTTNMNQDFSSSQSLPPTRPEPHAGTMGMDPSVYRYTPLSDLTEKEKEHFLAQIFTLGRIPTRPPPQEMCF